MGSDAKLFEDLQHLDYLLDTTRRQSIAYLNSLSERPTSVQTANLEEAVLPLKGMGAKDAIEYFNHRFKPLIVSSSGPRYWGFVTGGSTPAAIIGDWLASVYDQNTQSTYGHGDVSANIEIETIRLLLDLFGLPHQFLGGFVTGATMSNFTCLGVARQWIGKKLGKDFAREGVGLGINVLSAVPHSSAVKSLSMLGIGSNNIIRVNVLPGNREALDPADLEMKIQELNGRPFILISSAGTVNTVDFDNFEAIAQLKRNHDFWWHIDGAFGAFAACSPEYQHLLNGWDQADSITIDCHKWLNVPYESAFFLVRQEHRILQMQTFQNSNAPYLGDPLDNFSYLNFLPENSRRLKALPVWFTLQAYGKEGYRKIVERCIALAKEFGDYLESTSQFELLAPVRLNNICFTLAGNENQERVPEFLSRLNDSGKVFMTPTIYNGRKGIRASFVNWRTTREDVKMVMDQMAITWKELFV